MTTDAAFVAELHGQMARSRHLCRQCADIVEHSVIDTLPTHPSLSLTCEWCGDPAVIYAELLKGPVLVSSPETREALVQAICTPSGPPWL